jgi:tRNA-specific 2-thiouridylase
MLYNVTIQEAGGTVQRDERIAVLVSGGVDSSTALWRLKQQGYRNLHAYYLKIWLEDELSFLGECPWEEDLRFAREVCETAEVPLEVVPLQLEYYERVVQYAIAELRRGRTPSPDIFCNQRIKFGAFFDTVQESADRVATGHYARVLGEGDAVRLFQAPDPVKDQTYFLSHLSREQLAHAVFPIGEMHKDEVRRAASELDLPNKDRKDSQGICFLGNIKYPEFVKYYLGEQQGTIVEYETGRKLGEHKGFWFFTIGQRQGLGLGNGPWYVVAKEPESNTIFVSHRSNAADRMRADFFVEELHWISAPAQSVSDALSVKIRHGPEKTSCSVTPEEHGLRVTMSEADRGIAPGQFAVFYRGEECLGSGRIAE